MKTTTFFSTLIALALMGTANLYAQYGLGTNAPNAQAALHIESTSHGVLIPNVALTNAGTLFPGVTNPTAEHESMLVYNTSTSTANGLSGPGFYYWADGVGGSWVRLQSGSAGSITPATIDPGTDGQVLTTSGTGTAATVIWETPTVATTSHWNVQGGTTPATLNTQDIVQNGDVAVGTATNRKDLSFTGALYSHVRFHTTDSPIVWQDDDFYVVLTSASIGKIALSLPNPATNANRMLSIGNQTGSQIFFAGSTPTDPKYAPENFSDIRSGYGYLFISDGTKWYALAAR